MKSNKIDKMVIDKRQEGNISRIFITNCDENDFVKYGIIAEREIKDIQNESQAIIIFETYKGKKDTLIFDKIEVAKIKEMFNKYPCIDKSTNHIIDNIPNDRILFYDSLLYEILQYDMRLNKIDTMSYAKRDISIVSIIQNKCKYKKERIPLEYEIQNKYLNVLYIWCEDSVAYPKFNQNDFLFK